jgi:hypothetical protein
MTRLLIYLIIIPLVLSIWSCSTNQNESTEKKTEDVDSILSEPHDSLVLVIEGKNNRTVFSLTMEKYAVEYIGSAIGNFVHAIDSIEIDQNFSWVYSVNDTMGSVASDKRLTKNGDIIKWHFRAF